MRIALATWVCWGFGCNPNPVDSPQAPDPTAVVQPNTPLQPPPRQRGVDVHRLHDLLQSEEVPVLVDVRSPKEFADGHAPGAQNLPLDELDAGLEFLEGYRDQDIYLMCRSGGRSKRAAGLLSARGFSVVDVTGGLIAWQNAGLPVQK